MRKKESLVLLASLTLLVFQWGCPNGDKEIQIPFEIFRNDIRVLAQVNGRDCYCLLDNGSLWDELLFFGSPKVDSLKLPITGETIIGDPNAANPVVADTASDIAIRFGDFVLSGQKAVITRYTPGLPNLWEGADVQVSAAFFKNFVVEINFDEMMIKLIPPEKFKHTGPGQEIRMHPGPFESRTITVDLVMLDGSEHSMDVLVDLGGVHPLYLPIGRDDRITLPENAVDSVLGNGLSGPVHGYLARIKTVKIGEYALHDVVTAYTAVSQDDGVYGNTMIGLPLLRRFNVIFDDFNDRLILEPNRSFEEPFPFPKTPGR
jgi:hypothetical protein